MPLSMLSVPAIFVMVLSQAPEGPARGVVLGARGFGLPDAEGWGIVAPAEIFNGGAPSGFVSDIQWTSWGPAAYTQLGSGAAPARRSARFLDALGRRPEHLHAVPLSDSA